MNGLELLIPADPRRTRLKLSSSSRGASWHFRASPHLMPLKGPSASASGSRRLPSAGDRLAIYVRFQPRETKGLFRPVPFPDRAQSSSGPTTFRGPGASAPGAQVGRSAKGNIRCAAPRSHRRSTLRRWSWPVSTTPDRSYPPRSAGRGRPADRRPGTRCPPRRRRPPGGVYRPRRARSGRHPRQRRRGPAPRAGRNRDPHGLRIHGQGRDRRGRIPGRSPGRGRAHHPARS